MTWIAACSGQRGIYQEVRSNRMRPFDETIKEMKRAGQAYDDEEWLEEVAEAIIGNKPFPHPRGKCTAEIAPSDLVALINEMAESKGLSDFWNTPMTDEAE